MERRSQNGGMLCRYASPLENTDLSPQQKKFNSLQCKRFCAILSTDDNGEIHNSIEKSLDFSFPLGYNILSLLLNYLQTLKTKHDSSINNSIQTPTVIGKYANLFCFLHPIVI